MKKHCHVNKQKLKKKYLKNFMLIFLDDKGEKINCNNLLKKICHVHIEK